MQTQNMEEIKAQQLKALEYYANNGVIRFIEDILNKAFSLQPKDIYFFLSCELRQRIQTPLPLCIVMSPEVSPDIFYLAVISTWKNKQTLLGSHKYLNNYLKNFTVEENGFSEVLQPISELICNLEFASNSQYDLDTWLRQRYAKMLGDKSSVTACMTSNGENVEQKNPLTPGKPTKKKKSAEQTTAIPSSVIFGALKEAVIFSSCSIAWSMAIAQSRLLPEDYEGYYPAYKVFTEIAMLCTEDICEAEAKHMPTPIFTIFSGAENATFGGKCHFIKALLLIPSKQVSATEVRSWLKILDPKTIIATAPANFRIKMLVTQAGAITFPFDKPEQVIDFFVGYLKSCGLDSSFVLGLQIRPYAIYDEARNTYDAMSGFSKSPNDLAKFYGDLSQIYPIIKLYIDPFRAEDVEAWNMLDSLSSTKQGERIYLSTSTTASRAAKPASAEMVPEDTFEQTLLRRTTSPSVAFLSSLARGEEVEMDAGTSKEREAGLEPAPSETTRPKRDTRPTNAKQRGKAKAEEELETLSSSAQLPQIQPAHKVASCWMWNCAVTEDCLLVSEMAQAVAYMRKQGKTVIFDVDGVDVDECWTVDLAVGLGADFINFSGSGCSDNVRKMKRWLSILDEHALGCATETPFCFTLSSVSSSSSIDT